jgi:hypothetical protein
MRSSPQTTGHPVAWCGQGHRRPLSNARLNLPLPSLQSVAVGRVNVGPTPILLRKHPPLRHAPD